MRSDLRRLLWQLRAQVIRRSTLDEAVEEACAGLVAERFDETAGLRAPAPCVLPLLERFEDEIACARHVAPEGDHHRAVRAVEGAERALAAARRLSGAWEEWEGVRAEWSRWSERLGLAVLSDLTTVREVERLLALARQLLEAREDRKARFVVRRCRALVGRLDTRAPEPERRTALLGRLETLKSGSIPIVARLDEVIDRLVRQGRLELAGRLLDDWEMETAGVGPLGPSGRQALARIAATAREAATIKGVLGPSPASGERSAEHEPGAGELEKGA